jgi:hypothetical protein
MPVNDLGPDEQVVLLFAPCQRTVQWSRERLIEIVGPWQSFREIGLHERLRCTACGKSPSNAWPSWQEH